MGKDRPGWDEYFMSICNVVSTRSNCCRRNVGAVIVKDTRIISTGYNGTPKGIANCFDGGCDRCNEDTPSGASLHECLCSHAEENAIVQAACHGIAIKGSTLYCNLSPCLTCSKMIINAGIVEVIYGNEYKYSTISSDLFTEASVFIRKIEDLL